MDVNEEKEDIKKLLEILNYTDLRNMIKLVIIYLYTKETKPIQQKMIDILEAI